MSRLLSMAYLTAAALTPAEAVRLAAKLGYDRVGIRILPVAPGGAFAPLVTDAAMLRETRAAIADTGVGVFDVEIIRLDDKFDVAACRPFLETCASLGASAVLVAGDDPDIARLTASFAAFAGACASYGVTADLEFMPWTEVPDAQTARRVVEGAGAPNGRVLVDALHFARSNTSLADIAALPAALLSYAQICDAPTDYPRTTEAMIHTARLARWLPGEGGVDLVELFAHLPGTLPISVEIPNEAGIARFGQEEWARRALDLTRRVLALADARRAELDGIKD